MCLGCREAVWLQTHGWVIMSYTRSPDVAICLDPSEWPRTGGARTAPLTQWLEEDRDRLRQCSPYTVHGQAGDCRCRGSMCTREPGESGFCLRGWAAGKFTTIMGMYTQAAGAAEITSIDDPRPTWEPRTKRMV